MNYGVSLVEVLQREQTGVDLAVEAVVILGSLARGMMTRKKNDLMLLATSVIGVTNICTVYIWTDKTMK